MYSATLLDFFHLFIAERAVFNDRADTQKIGEVAEATDGLPCSTMLTTPSQ